MSEYHKIETIFDRDKDTFKVNPELLRKPVFADIGRWHWTEKIDGTNIRIIWEHTTERIDFRGRTDNANIPADLIAHLRETFTRERLLVAFPETDAIIYGEGFGAGIQKGGGYSPKKIFAAFDVFIPSKENIMGGWWLRWSGVQDVCDKIGIRTVPDFGYGTLSAAITVVQHGFESAWPGAKQNAEGLVLRPVETLYDARGSRVIAKIKTRDFNPHKKI